MTTKHPTLDLARERVLGRAAGTAGAVATLGALAAVAISAQGATGGALKDEGGQKVQALQNLHENASAETLGLVFRCVGVLLVIAVGLFFVKAAADRDHKPAGRLMWFTVVAPLVLSAAIAGSYLSAHGAANDFAVGPQTAARAEALFDESAAIRSTTYVEMLAHVVFGLWIVMLAWRTMAVGILTRTLGYWGIGAAIIGAFIPIGDALFMGFLASISVVAWGWWPGGLPRAWAEGRAIPWDDESTVAPALTGAQR